MRLHSPKLLGTAWIHLFQGVSEDVMNVVEAWIKYVGLLPVPGHTVCEKNRKGFSANSVVSQIIPH